VRRIEVIGEQTHRTEGLSGTDEVHDDLRAILVSLENPHASFEQDVRAFGWRALDEDGHALGQMSHMAARQRFA